MSREADRLKGAIESFVDDVCRVKGKIGRIRLSAEQRSAGPSGARDIIASSPFIHCDMDLTRQNASALIEKTLHISQQYCIRVIIPSEGYFYLFNFGTSGTCKRLIPSCHEKRFVNGGDVITIPSAGDFGNISFITVHPPTSAEHGLPERLFAVLTKVDINLRLADLDPSLTGRHTATQSASKGFSGPPCIARPRLFALAPDEWEYGLLEMIVCE